MSWAADEFETIDLGDQRLNRRAVLLAERLAAQPTASIPAACGGWAETQAAYRLLSDDDIEWADILAPHLTQTHARMAAHPVVLCIQDTTELDFNGQAIEGLGPLSFEAQRGMYLHPTYAVSPAREPLGVLDAWMWAREPKADDGPRGGITESVRWIEGYERIAERAAELPDTRLVYVADREADIIALMMRARDLGCPADWLLRSQHNRALPGGDKLWASVRAGEPLGEIRFTIPSRKGQKARAVRQQVWSSRVTLKAGEGRVEATCVIAFEIGAPAGVKPIEWRLLSNREAAGFEAATELIDWYRARWEIELFFHVLKNGCKVEALQLATMPRLERALTLFMVVSWRIARLMGLGRTCPELEAELLFERDEWEAAFILNKRRPPETPPPLNEVIRLVAMLGGFLARKGDGEPGVKTIWTGLQRVMDFAAGLKYARGDHDDD
ncbi:IS4 family transposase [Aromatoleum bremense]|uniref:IS4 family transposase n=1 Tax=Aromatoleum bremense TaxID=76115 RepID=A0ABX1NR04_9RHOO|nr:IS4 family transposase [Aromatoleum bremense]NMG14223.1 IS4 family transposase [Aromatoleum bremense]QTQ34004.1 Putative transposase, IS4/Tn5-like [Aromatoleum bremense]